MINLDARRRLPLYQTLSRTVNGRSIVAQQIEARSLLDRENLLTDGGKDFRSNHLQQISAQLGFVCHLRDRQARRGNC
jgi:hypothetical protein